MDKASNKEKILWLGLVVLIVLFVLYSWLFGHPLVGRGLWQDEAMLANNIVNRGFTDLLEPLDYHQVASPLFLLISKFLCQLFGYSEVVLRSISVFGFIISIVLVYKVSNIIFESEYYGIIAMLLFSTNGHLLYFAVEFKPYMTDVLIAMSLIYLSLKRTRKSRFGFYALSLCSVYLSAISPAITFSGLIYIALTDVNKKRLKIELLVFIPIWLIGIGLFYIFFVHDHPHSEFMNWYWNSTFLRLDSFQSILTWVEFAFLNMFKGLYFPYSIHSLVFIALFFIGCIVSFKLTKKLFIFFILPILIHIAINIFRLYPFQYRFTIYYWPIIFIVSVGAIKYLNSYFNLRFDKGVLTILICASVFQQLKTPLKRFDVFPVLKEINSAKNEVVFLDAAVVPIYEFYLNTNRIQQFQEVVQIPNCFITEYAKLHPETEYIDINSFKRIIKDVNRSTWLISSIKSCEYQDQIASLIDLDFEVIEFTNYEGGYSLLKLIKKTGLPEVSK